MDNFVNDEKNDDFLNASAEEWSKPSTPAERPPAHSEPTDRWGSPTTFTEFASSADTPTQARSKKFSAWWILLIVLLVIACCCVSVLLISGSIGLGFNFFQTIFPSP